MASKRTAAQISAKITAELRWFTFTAAMIGQECRQHALVTASSQTQARLDTVLDLYAEYLTAKDEQKVSDEVTAIVESNVDQCGELNSSITQAVAEIDRRRSGDDGRPTQPPIGPEISTPLPPVAVPTFSGDYADWPRFRDLFDSVIHSRSGLQSAYKMAQLLARLEGEPHSMISHLPVTDDSYDIARRLLIDRYENRRLIVDRLLEQIFTGPRVTCTGDIRSNLLNPVSVAVNVLERQDLAVAASPYNYVLVHTMLRRLPSDVVARFEQLHGGDSAKHLPSYEDLKSFLETECRRADGQSGGSTATVSGPSRRTERSDGTGSGKGRSGEARRTDRRYNTAVTESVCLYCKASGHGVTGCSKFQSERVQKRRGVAQQRRWCFRCLGPHMVRECPKEGSCRFCKGTHHELLCMNRSGAATSPGRQSPASERGSRGRRSPPAHDRQAPRRPQNVPARTERQEELRDAPPYGPPEQDVRGPGVLGPTGGCQMDRRSQGPQAYAQGPHAQGQGPYVHYSAGTSAMPRYGSARMSPPLAERPRLCPRPPQFGRVPAAYYRPPQMAQGGRGVYYPAWNPYTALGVELPPQSAETESPASR